MKEAEMNILQELQENFICITVIEKDGQNAVAIYECLEYYGDTIYLNKERLEAFIKELQALHKEL